jgi:hypothetical protein
MQCYVSLFERSEVRSIVRYGPDAGGVREDVTGRQENVIPAIYRHAGRDSYPDGVPYIHG